MLQTLKFQRLPTSVLVVASLGILARVFIALLSQGSDDIRTWEQFALAANNYGLTSIYSNTHPSNHPPLISYLVAACYQLAVALNIPFRILFRLCSVIAEAITLIVLFKYALRKFNSDKVASNIIFHYSLGLVPIMISSFHGNTDAICVMFALCSLYLLDVQKCSFWAGLLLGCSINIKLIPILLVPIFASHLRKNKDIFFFITGLCLSLIPIFWAVIVIGRDFVSQVLLYSPVLSIAWGLQALCLIKDSGTGDIRDCLINLSNYGKFLILVPIVNIAVFNRIKQIFSIDDLVLFTFLIMLVFAPAFSLQYLIYPIPFLLLARTQLSSLTSLCVGAYLAVTYLGNEYWDPIAAVLSAVSWCLLFANIYLLLKSRLSGVRLLGSKN